MSSITQTIEIQWSERDSLFRIKCPSFDGRASQAPQSVYDGIGWVLPPTADNMRYMQEQYNRKYFNAPAMQRLLQEKATQPKAEEFPAWFTFKNEPMEKQWIALNECYADKSHALFMEMGTGKTFVTINVGAARAMNGNINAMVVLCPTSVKPVWEIEFEKHCPIGTNIHVLESGKTNATERFW